MGARLGRVDPKIHSKIIYDFFSRKGRPDSEQRMEDKIPGSGALFRKMKADFGCRRIFNYFPEGKSHVMEKHTGKTDAELVERALSMTIANHRSFEIKEFPDSSASTFEDFGEAAQKLQAVFGDPSFFLDFFDAYSPLSDAAREEGAEKKMKFTALIGEGSFLRNGYAIENGRVREFVPDSIAGYVRCGNATPIFETVYSENSGHEFLSERPDFREEIRRMPCYKELSVPARLFLEIQNSPTLPDFSIECRYGNSMTFYAPEEGPKQTRCCDVVIFQDDNGAVHMEADVYKKNGQKWEKRETLDLRYRDDLDYFREQFPETSSWTDCFWNEIQAILEAQHEEELENGYDDGWRPEGIAYESAFELARRPDVTWLEQNSDFYVQGIDLRNEPSVDKLNTLDKDLLCFLPQQTIENLWTYLHAREDLTAEEVSEKDFIQIDQGLMSEIDSLSGMQTQEQVLLQEMVREQAAEKEWTRVGPAVRREMDTFEY